MTKAKSNYKGRMRGAFNIGSTNHKLSQLEVGEVYILPNRPATLRRMLDMHNSKAFDVDYSTIVTSKNKVIKATIVKRKA